MKQRKIFITGASGGIGLAAARRFAQNGDALFLQGFQNRKPLEDLQLEFPQIPIQCRFCGLGDPEQQDLLVEEAWHWRDRPGLDAVVLAAGVDILTGERKSWSFERNWMLFGASMFRQGSESHAISQKRSKMQTRKARSS